MISNKLPSETRIWRFFGIPRSGNHAIIEWFIQNLDDSSTIFLNNCREGDPFTAFSYCNFVYGGHKRKHRANIRREKNHHFDRLLEKRKTVTDLVVSYEIMSPRSDQREQLHRLSGVENKPSADFLIIRSPLNLIASNLAKMRKDIKKTPRQLRSLAHLENWLPVTYQEYLRTALNDEAHAIFYDRWGADEVYRTEILTDAGLKPKALDLGAMTTAGGGSSFDRGQDVETISMSKRWPRFTEDEDFLRLVNAVLKADTSGLIRSRFPEDWAEALNF